MKKTFDAIEMKRQGALRIYEETKDMSLDQQLAYWRKHDEELRRLQEAIIAHRGSGQTELPREIAAFLDNAEVVVEATDS